MRLLAFWVIPLLALLVFSSPRLIAGLTSDAMRTPPGFASSTVNQVSGGPTDQRVQGLGETRAVAASSSGVGSAVYWVGGQTSGEDNLTNAGVRATIDVVPMNVTGCLSFWVSDDSAADMWAQVGYAMCNGDAPFAFYQVWDLTSGTIAATGTSELAPGPHLFSLSRLNGTVWAFEVDSVGFGASDLRAAWSKPGYPVYFLSEESGVQSASTPLSVRFANVEQSVAGGWSEIGTAYSYGTAWGLAGNAQASTASRGTLVIGGGLAPLAQGSILWVNS